MPTQWAITNMKCHQVQEHIGKCLSSHFRVQISEPSLQFLKNVLKRDGGGEILIEHKLCTKSEVVNI